MTSENFGTESTVFVGMWTDAPPGADYGLIRRGHLVRLGAGAGGRQGWVVDLEIPLRDPSDRLHHRVTLTPLDEDFEIADLQEEDQLRFVAIGPAPDDGGDPTYGWFRGEVGRAASLWDGWRPHHDPLGVLEAWLRTHPHEYPSPSDELEGVRILGVAERLKSQQFAGHLDSNTEDRFSALPGWTWWECDDIDLIARYVQGGGSTPLTLEQQFEDRPIGVVALQLRSSFEAAMAHPESPALGGRDVRRLREIPGWPSIAPATWTPTDR